MSTRDYVLGLHKEIERLQRSLRMRERDLLWILREGIPDAGEDLIDGDDAATDQRLLDYVRITRVEMEGGSDGK